MFTSIFFPSSIWKSNTSDALLGKLPDGPDGKSKVFPNHWFGIASAMHWRCFRNLVLMIYCRMKWHSDELHGIAQLSPLMSSFVTTLQGKCRRAESRTRKNISLFFPLSRLIIMQCIIIISKNIWFIRCTSCEAVRPPSGRLKVFPSLIWDCLTFCTDAI